MDDEAYRILSEMASPNVHLISLDEFQRDDEPLQAAKTNRSRFEYYFTCTPSLPLFILRHNPEVDVITYLDADLYFYSNPEPIFEEFGNGSTLIIGHRFPKPLRHLERVGIYNVGLLAFRNDSVGRSVLQWWRERCLENCKDRPNEHGFADQKYLDDWPARFERVVVLQHRGAGLAPWNVSGYDISGHDGSVFVDSQPLIFYHFAHLNIHTRLLFDPFLHAYKTKLTSVLRRGIYAPYLRELQSLSKETSLAAGSNRYTSSKCDRRELSRLIIYGWPLLVLGPISAELHLEPIARPFLAVRRLLLGKPKTSLQQATGGDL